MTVDSRTTISLGIAKVEVEIISPTTMDLAEIADRDWRPLVEAARTEDREWPTWQQIIADQIVPQAVV
jgi:hypothetical protein